MRAKSYSVITVTNLLIMVFSACVYTQGRRHGCEVWIDFPFLEPRRLNHSHFCNRGMEVFLLMVSNHSAHTGVLGYASIIQFSGQSSHDLTSTSVNQLCVFMSADSLHVLNDMHRCLGSQYPISGCVIIAFSLMHKRPVILIAMNSRRSRWHARGASSPKVWQTKCVFFKSHFVSEYFKIRLRQHERASKALELPGPLGEP